MTLADRMKKRMSELALTQEAVANRADISQGMVYKLVSGTAKSTSKIVPLAQALECDVEWLATGNLSARPNQIQEHQPSYHKSTAALKTEIKKQIKSLSVKDQKALAMEIMDELLNR